MVPEVDVIMVGECYGVAEKVVIGRWTALCVHQKWWIKIPLAPMGVLAPRSAHARPSARPPIDTSGNFQAHVSA
jgi:hypothetical protein